VSEPVSSRAIASLVFGILAFNGCPCIGGVLAVLLGAGERSGIGRAGFVLGWIHLALFALVLFVVLATALVMGVGEAVR